MQANIMKYLRLYCVTETIFCRLIAEQFNIRCMTKTIFCRLIAENISDCLMWKTIYSAGQDQLIIQTLLYGRKHLLQANCSKYFRLSHVTKNIFCANLSKSIKIIICVTENIKHAVQKHFQTYLRYYQRKDIVPAQ